MAAELPIAERLKIKWDAISTDDIGRYMGLLAAVEQVAIAINVKNGGKGKPSDEDYRAAFAAWCFWPLNKPPLAEQYWSKTVAAFSSQKARDALQAGLGPLAAELPALIKGGQGSDAVIATWPQDETDYVDKVWNFKNLVNGQ